MDVCGPIAELVLEAINFSIIQNGFGVEDWHAKFREIDYRAAGVVEGIRDQRLRNGSWTLNKYRAEIGEPPVEGGDDVIAPLASNTAPSQTKGKSDEGENVEDDEGEEGGKK